MKSFIYKQNICSYNYPEVVKMEIEMMGSEFKEFSDIFDKLYTGLEPLYSVIGSIERSMVSSGFNYFKLPAFKSTDLKNHYFIFKIENNKFVFSECK